MVETGVWAAGDDNRLLLALLQSGAEKEWDVTWGNLLPVRKAGRVIWLATLLASLLS